MCFAVAFSADGRALASVGDGILFWEAITGQKLFAIRGHTQGVAIAFSPNGRILASGT